MALMGQANRRERLRRHALFWLVISFFILPLLLAQRSKNQILVLEVKGVIDPPIASYVLRGIQEAKERSAEALILSLDTPGGLDDAMRNIIQGILSSPVPVVVYVSPSGARAASAGALITLSSHIAAMAPSTTIGAAHPVRIGGGGPSPDEEELQKKITNDAAAYARSIAQRRGRNVEWAEKAVRQSISSTEEEALKQKVIDIIAKDLDDLKRLLNGRKVDGKELHTLDAEVVSLPMTPKEVFLHILSNPNITVLLLTLAIYGLIGELSHPGAIFPGIVGATSLILALYSFSVLSLNTAGLLLILLAVLLFIVDLFVPSHGLISLGAAAILGLGFFLLYENSPAFLRASVAMIISVVLLTTGFFLFGVSAGLRARRRPVATGREGLLGESGLIVVGGDRPQALIRGEYWRVKSEVPLEEGDTVIVEGFDKDNLVLKVRKEEKNVG